MAKNKIPSREKINELKGKLSEELKDINEIEKKGSISPKRSFLMEVKEEIKNAMDSGTSLTGIKKAIKKIYGVDVSTQIISDFAHNELGIQKRKKAPNSNRKNIEKDSSNIDNNSNDLNTNNNTEKLSIKEQRQLQKEQGNN